MLQRFNYPAARTALMAELNAKGLVRAATDVSDGFCSAVHNICRESGCGALVEYMGIPLFEGFEEFCRKEKQEPLELKKIIEGISDLLAGQLKAKEIEFSAQIAESANPIFADHGQINRVLINLLGNALKFTPKQGKIKISAAKVDRWTQVDISDTGCGIPPEELDAVFEEFYRVDNPINQEAKGTGLGLSLVKHIVEAHKGKIWVRSSPGAGSTFSFTIPQASPNI